MNAAHTDTHNSQLHNVVQVRLSLYEGYLVHVDAPTGQRQRRAM